MQSEDRALSYSVLRERRMLGFIFGFNARLGRLQYFLASIGLAVVSVVLIVVVAVGVAAIAPERSALAISGPIIVTIGLSVVRACCCKPCASGTSAGTRSA